MGRAADLLFFADSDSACLDKQGQQSPRQNKKKKSAHGELHLEAPKKTRKRRRQRRARKEERGTKRKTERAQKQQVAKIFEIMRITKVMRQCSEGSYVRVDSMSSMVSSRTLPVGGGL